jgi:hypothetical protein
MGQGIMQDVAERMIGEMARNMEALLAPAAPAEAASSDPPKAKPIKGISLILGVLGDRIRRLFTRSG